MTAASPFTIGLVLVGVFLAALYGALATERLLRVTKLMPLAADHGEGSASNEVPTMRFEGEAFEERWQGSRGYARPTDPAAGQNWTDRLVIPVLSPLRPSRFGDPSYWRSAQPGSPRVSRGLGTGRRLRRRDQCLASSRNPFEVYRDGRLT